MSRKIGFVTERLLLGFGVDLVVHQYASFLHARGYDVTVFCLRHEPNVAREYKVIDLAKQENLVLSGSMPRNIVNFARFFNACQLDVWIVNTPPFYDVIPLLVSPCIAIEYGTPPSRFFSEAIGRNLDASIAYRFRYVFPYSRGCDKILCISRSIQHWLPQPVRTFSDVVYLGCDHYGRVGEAEVRGFRRNLGVRDDEILVLWVGRVQVHQDQQPYKGFPEFITIVETAMGLDHKMKFVVVGRGGVCEAHFLHSKGIISCLNLADEQMGMAYAAADIFLNTSKWEGFNLPLLEAQFQGVPVLAYNYGPHPEVCRDGQTGLLVEGIDSMVEQLLALAKDRGKRAALGLNAKTFAVGFSWAKSCSELAAAINDVLSPPSSSPSDSIRRFLSGSGSVFFVVLDTYRRFGLATVLEGILTSVRKRFTAILR
jgi:glycosyltransferase involved in cell wall biosynthesis